ncbi:unnamed protein product [Fusarium equiseti]|uniref:Uncharacterized protein n=1 Tax=Fusarium equiseti TaxID=61235 RepID=A0A8J2J1T0_FUSEQ|nr:unnamed protein product [Fusarium equiseti]
MVSTRFLTGVLALLAANAVSAGPCKPSSSTVYTTTTVETTTTETSSATVSESLTETFTSLGSTETINSLSTSAETSTAFGTSTRLLTTTEEPTSSVAASVTTSATAVECTTNADCDGATPFCDAGTGVATDPNVECSTNSECLILHGGDAPFCSAAGNCIGRHGDGDCYGEIPYCDNDFCNDVVGHSVSRL